MHSFRRLPSPALLFWMLCVSAPLCGQAPYQKNASPDTEGDKRLWAFFAEEVGRIESRGIVLPESAEAWPARKAELQRQLREMLLLEPMPERTDLKAATMGKVERDRVVVEKVHFQSSPGLYVTGNLYLPAKFEGKAPAVLYLCGHGAVKEDGVSFGNKVHYQHHGVWFARQGYVCLVIDSLQLGEIEGLHHGTYNLNQWWWVCRGYSPAGVEAWNCVRALDYLCSRSEVDAERIGVTGRSGGGAYSWWIAAIDERVKAAAPVAGMTDLRDYVVEDCIEGHCDCMFMNNTHQWDYPQVAALVAPRPLLLVNTDSDDLFPLKGVTRTFFQVRELYSRLGKADQFAFSCSPGGHVDSQEVQLAAFTWLNLHLKGEKGPVTEWSEKIFQPEELKVFAELPSDQINTKIQESFGPPSPAPVVPESQEEWAKIVKEKKAFLLEKVFKRLAAAKGETLHVASEVHDIEGDLELRRVRAYDFDVDQKTFAERYVIRKIGATPAKVFLMVMDDAKWEAMKGEIQIDEALKQFDVEKAVRDGDAELVIYCPPGVGEWKLNADAKERNHLARRALLLGDTLAGMQVHDLARVISTLPEGSETTISAGGELAGVAVYAAIFGGREVRLELEGLPGSHGPSLSSITSTSTSTSTNMSTKGEVYGPILINVLRGLDLPEAAAIAAEGNRVRIKGVRAEDFRYVFEVKEKLGWGEERVLIEK